jgi:two-component system phosphate regulon response regulator PhoB
MAAAAGAANGRAAARHEAEEPERLVYADVELDAARHRVRRAGRPVHLAPTEYRLLRHLLEHPERVFSRAQLLRAVWGPDAGVSERSVDVHIRRLRTALGDPDRIRTVRSAGYSLDAGTP